MTSPVSFEDQVADHSQRLLPARELPLRGEYEPCFYCGMTRHQPASCPSKLLDARLQGLSLVGYLPFAELDACFQAGLTASDDLLEKLPAGITASQIRRDPILQVFLAFFDINRVYQLRFLQQIAFNSFKRWEPLCCHEQPKITNRNLHLGLDCLRVGQLSQAEQILAEEAGRQKGYQFCALVGRAFTALEQGREKDMETFLRKAADQAVLEKERVYIGLLLSRFYDLLGERWKAEQAVDTILSQDRSCQEAIYRKCQLLAGNGSRDGVIKQLRSLITGERELFMAVLMDPMLVPVQDLVEELLSALYRDAARNANGNLNRAAAAVYELRTWYEEEDDELQKVVDGLAAAEKQHFRHSYYDVLDADTQAQRLYFQCHRLRENRIDRLRTRLAQVTGRWQGYHAYWGGYSYQTLFSRFGEVLSMLRQKLDEVQALSRKFRGDAYLAATARLREVESDLDELRSSFTRMIWVKVALDGIRTFGRKLVIAELLLAIPGMILLYLFHFHLAGRITGIPDQLFVEPRFLKQLVSVVTILLAPLLALILTLWDLADSRQENSL